MRYLLFLLLLLAHACVQVPSHELAKLEDSCGCETVVHKTDIEIGDWPNPDWWRQFDDPVLTGLIEQALLLSPTLKKAEENLKAAHQVSIQKRARLFPEVDLSGTDNWQHLPKSGFFRAFAPTVPAMVNDVTIGLSYFYEFDFWGKNRDLFRSALGQEAAMAAEKLQAELILTTSIAYTYSELQLLLRKKDLLEQIEANTKAIEQIRGKRVKNSLDAEPQELTSRSGTLDSSAPLVQIKEAIEDHLHKLKALSGVGQDAQLEIVYKPLNAIQVALPERLDLDLVAMRPDLVAQRQRVESAAKLIDAAKTDFYPNINISGLIGTESVIWSKLFTRDGYGANMEPAIHLPIFTAGRIKAQLMEKVAEFNEAVFDYNNLILHAAQEIADVLSSLMRLQKEIEIRDHSLSVAQKQEEITNRRFINALDDRMSLLAQKNSVLQWEITLSELVYGKQLAKINLIRALGGGYRE